MIKIQPCFGLAETDAPLLSPLDAARLARAFAAVLPPGGRVLLAGDGSGGVVPAMLGCSAQMAFMGHPVTDGSGCRVSMLHDLIPRLGFAGGMGFFGKSCFVVGADGRCPNDALWNWILAMYDGGSPEDLPEAAASGKEALPETALSDYWKHLSECVDAAPIRKAGLRVACCGLPESARFGEIFGVEMLPFSCPEAAAEALPYVRGICGLIFESSGKRLTLIDGNGKICTPDSTMLLGSAIALERGEKSVVFGGLSTKSWRELMLKYNLNPCTVPSGEGSAIVSGRVCGDLDGAFSFGGNPGYDALRSAAYILSFLAESGSLAEPLNRLRHYHLQRRELAGVAANPLRLKGRFTADDVSEYLGGIRFDFTDGGLLVQKRAYGGVLIVSEAKKLQDARERLEIASQFLTGGEQ